jgi:putative transposase
VRRASELEAFIAELFLAGLSTRDVQRVSLNHFGEKISSKEVSRVVAHVSSELDGFRHRSLADRRFTFLFLDGSYFKVRRADRVDRVPFLAVVGIAEDDKVEVLGLDCGDRERCDFWEGLLRNLIERGLRAEAGELGIMDGLPGLEALFRRLFPRRRSALPGPRDGTR